MSKSRDQLEAWLGKLEVKAEKVLDVGGSQRPIKDRVKSWDVGGYLISDLAEPHEIKQKPDLMFDLNLPLGAGIDIGENMQVAINDVLGFDIIFCIEVMEYIYDPMTAIRNLAKLMKLGGTLYLSAHFIYPIHRPSGTDMLRYTDIGLAKLLELNGFEVKKIDYKMMSGLASGYWQKYNEADGNRPDREYPHHEAQGYIITAVKV